MVLDHGNLWLHRLDNHLSTVEALCQRFEERDRMLQAEEGGRVMSTISSVTLDQASGDYPPGATVTLTVTGNWITVDTITVETPDGGTGTTTMDIIEPVKVTDTGGHTWTEVSNNGTQAVFTTQA